MLVRKLVSLGALLASASIVVACSLPAEEVDGAAAEALTSDSVGLVCRTLGEIGQCGSSSLCRAGKTGMCKAKEWALRQDQSWQRFCNNYNWEMCRYSTQYCTWEDSTTCSPANGTPAKPGPVDVATTCSTLGELGACGGVAACKTATEHVCRATDDAIAFDPQWQQMCPRAGTNQEACDAQGPNCYWDDVQSCTARGTGKLPLDVGTACKTLGQSGACGLAPTVCRRRSTGLCSANAASLAQGEEYHWERFCNAYGTSEMCGYAKQNCKWAVIDDCIPVTGSRPEAVVDAAKACDTFGQLGMCSRAPICKVIASATCRATAGALAADPASVSQCALASTSKDACDFIGPSCAWVPTTACIPR